MTQYNRLSFALSSGCAHHRNSRRRPSNLLDQAKKLFSPLRKAEISVIENIQDGKKGTPPDPLSSSLNDYTMRSGVLRWLISAVDED